MENGEGGTGTATGTRTRIFVGGLGGSVTADDLRKTFSSLGSVESINIVRTKGRSFAYLDFLPSSHNALPKLFSTYNGCMWKGGRLRLEKAKEHYLLRLRHEWAEDAELANSAPGNCVDAAKNMDSSEKNPKKVLNPEKMQLHIFFPKLKKVKTLPFSGTGKHKYSFQRVEVPSLPIHFCDCEEHSDPSHTTKEKHFHDLETQSGGIHEEELNMMKSVMNELFERENISKSARSRAGLAKEEDNSTKTTDDLLVGENEAEYVADEDNLIMNMVGGGNDKIALLGSRGQETISANEDSIFNEPRTSEDRPTRNMLKSQRRKIVPPNKKRKTPLTEESDGNPFVSAIPERNHLSESRTLLEAQIMEPESGIQQSNTNLSWSQKSAWRDLVGDRGNTTFRVSHIMPSTASSKEEQTKLDGFTESENQNPVKFENLESQSGQSKELKELAETQRTKPNAIVNKLARGASWLQKSSWTQLVGETNNSSFSISQILAGVTFEKLELEEPSGMDAANSTDSKHCNLAKSDISESTGAGSKALGVANEDLLIARNTSNMVALAKKEQNHAGLDVEQSTPEKNLQIVGENNEVSAPTLGKKRHSAPKQTSIGDGGISETCSFMRSAASMREWVNTKAALSGSLKKKGNEK